ncbi:ubiquitin-conjugating enzyme E2 32-like [Prunus avium]|uniref:Ubiquitin-conjugating enzyme E2 32-like n=1 Tax=Prunus avium TaxID=42229 RepID=A0A6P5SP20_PRUAV|nr:ubiquitin-conjugating enzyme E2 32-like [Prunus avium]
MLAYPNGELFSRRDLAIKSRAATPKYGTFTRQQVTDQINPNMLSKAPPVPIPQLQPTGNTPCQKKEFKNLSCDFGEGVYMGWTGKIYIDINLARDVIAEDKCNIKNSGEKRILGEYNEIESNPSHDFKCLKLACNKYEWQFAIRGPSGTEFEGGIYHGVVKFSEGYPSKPPSIMFLTKNGRFKIQTNISSRLLSNWQSPRSVRNALLTLIEEMPTYPDGDEEFDSVKYNKYNKEERRALAIKSRAAAPKYGTPECQKVIDVIHQYMLSNAPPVPQPQLSSPSQTSKQHEHFYFQNHGAKRKHGILRSMNEALDPMITKNNWVFFFVSTFLLSSILFGFWSSRQE